MLKSIILPSCLCLCGLLLLILNASLPAQQNDDEPTEETIEVQLADGGLTLQAPKSWKKIEPRFNMIEAEFSVETVGDDENNGRLTIMSSGGTIEQNIDRWIGQFSQPDGGPTKDVAKVETAKIDGMKVHMVDIVGTFADRPGGPVSPPTMRDNYRMLGAIIESENDGNYYVKFYGGKATIDENAELFKAFIKSLKAN